MTVDSRGLDMGLPPAEALTVCDREPIHRLGTLQPHGFLLALRAGLGREQAQPPATRAGRIDGRPPLLAAQEFGDLVAALQLEADAAQAIKDGKIEFSVDQQPYVQGYLAVTALYLNIKNGNDMGGGKPVLTGPSFVDASNIDKILPFAKNNTR